MTIWVDADACPVDTRGILSLAAIRCSVKLIFVANTPIATPASEMISSVLVKAGGDVADDYIADNCEAGDLVITADIPLAARIVAKGATGLDSRGEEFTEENVEQRLAMRNFMEEMRSGGMDTGGPSSPKASDTREFANALDRFLARHAKKNRK